MSDLLWLAADYHFPLAYSCRVPLSSMSSAPAMPAPSPSTVRLALVRVGIELFGYEDTRDVLFPHICASTIRVRPPEHIGISTQVLQAYKENRAKKKGEQSLIYREFAHASDLMTIWISVPSDLETEFNEMLMGIGYWGQGNSFTSCVEVRREEPSDGEFAKPIKEITATNFSYQPFQCIVSEFKRNEITWEEIMPSQTSSSDFLNYEIYWWPLEIIEQHSGGKILRRCSTENWRGLLNT